MQYLAPVCNPYHTIESQANSRCFCSGTRHTSRPRHVYVRSDRHRLSGVAGPLSSQGAGLQRVPRKRVRLLFWHCLLVPATTYRITCGCKLRLDAPLLWWRLPSVSLRRSEVRQPETRLRLRPSPLGAGVALDFVCAKALEYLTSQRGGMPACNTRNRMWVCPQTVLFGRGVQSRRSPIVVLLS